MRHHRGVGRLVRHFHGRQGLGQGADLVDLDQDRVGAAGLDAVSEPGDVGDEQIVADQLALIADRVGQRLPAVHVVFAHAVFDRDDRIARHEVGQILHLLGARAGLVLAAIDVRTVLEELGGGAVQRQHHVAAGGVAGLADRGHHEVERGIGRRQVRRKAALVADIGVVAGLLQLALEGVEDLRAAAQRFSEALGADRHDHEFLEIDRIVGMHTAIDDVHHRHRQHARRGAADIAIQRHVVGFRRRLGDRQRHAEDGVGAEPGLVRGAVEIDHDLIDLHLLFGIHAAERVEQLAIDGFHRLLHALAEIARLVTVAQLDRLMRAGRGAGRHRSAADRTVFQHHVDFDGGIAAAVEDFAANNVDNGSHDSPSECF